MFLHLCVSAFGRQLHFPGQPWSGWAHLSAMWGKITPSYSTILLPKLWLCDFFIRASFYYLSYWISLVQYLRFPWQNLYSLWNLSLLPQILLDLGSVKYHRRRNGKRHNIDTFQMYICSFTSNSWEPAVGVGKTMKNDLSSFYLREKPHVILHFLFYSGCYFVHILLLGVGVLILKHHNHKTTLKLQLHRASTKRTLQNIMSHTVGWSSTVDAHVRFATRNGNNFFVCLFCESYLMNQMHAAWCLTG